MKTKVKFIFVIFLVSGILLSKTRISADSSTGSSRHKWELGVGIGFNMHSIDATYNHTYSPIFRYSSPDDLFSTASEILNFKHEKSMGLNLMLNRMITKKVGIQLLAEYHKTTLQLTNNSFYYYLEYTDYPYPDFNPTLVTREGYNTAWDWLDSGGYLKQTSLGLNLLTRFYLSDAITFDFSGGPCFFGLRGEASSLKYLYWVFAHFILTNHSIVLKFSYKSAVRLGLNFGGEMNIPILRSLIFFLTCRYFYCPTVSSEIRFKEIIQPQSYILRDYIDEIISVMNPGPLKMNPSFLNLNAGFKLRF